MNPLSEDILQELHVRKRFELVRSLVNQMNELAIRTNNPIAKELMLFIDDFGALGAPSTDGGVYQFFQGEPEHDRNDYFFFAPIIKEDGERLDKEDFRYSYLSTHPNFVAQFREGSNAIYFSPYALSSLGLSIILFHEASHAYNELTMKYDKSQPDAYWYEEAETYIFECELLTALGEERYEAIVEDIVKRSTEDKNGRITFAEIDADKAIVLWHELFGESISEDEINLWSFVAHLDAVWRYLRSHPMTEDSIHEFSTFIKKNFDDPNPATPSVLETSSPTSFAN